MNATAAKVIPFGVPMRRIPPGPVRYRPAGMEHAPGLADRALEEAIVSRVSDDLPQADLWVMPIALDDETYLVTRGSEETRVAARTPVQAAARFAVAQLGDPLSLQFVAHVGARWYFDSAGGPLRVRQAPVVPEPRTLSLVEGEAMPA